MQKLDRIEIKDAGTFAQGAGVAEFKAAKDGMIKGYGAVFGNVDRGGDRIEPGAFADSLKADRKVKMLWQHDPFTPIGVWSAVEEDDHGLRVEGKILGDVDAGRSAAALIKAGAIDGLSIGYRTLEYRFVDEDNARIRVIEKAELWEVSLVTFPMNPEAVVDAVKAATMSQRDFGRKLGEGLPMSRRVADALMRDGWKGVQALSDSGGDDLEELVAGMLAATYQKTYILKG